LFAEILQKKEGEIPILNQPGQTKLACRNKLNSMPTLLRVRGIRFFFYSGEYDEPPHVHFEKGNAVGKCWLEPVEIAYCIGFKTSEKRLILQIIYKSSIQFKQQWNEYFDKKQ